MRHTGQGILPFLSWKWESSSLKARCGCGRDIGKEKEIGFVIRNLHIRKEIVDKGRQGLGVNTLVPTLSVRGHTALDAGVASVREGMPLGRESPGQVREGRALTRKRLCPLAGEARSMALR